MISVGALPAPGSGKYQIVWPDLWASSEKEKAEGAKTKSEALAAYLNAPGADQIIPIEFFLRDFLGLSQEQVDQIKKMLPEGDFPEPQEEPISGEEQPGGEEAGKKLQGVVGNLNSNAGNGHAGHGGAHAGHSGGNPNHDPSTGRFSAGAAATARIRELASAQLTHEELSTYDARGHLIRTIRGTEESVSANDMSGVHTAIHNHPGGDSFSSADIRTAFDNGISRAIVVGQQHVYIATELNLKRGNKLPYKKYTDDLRKTENKYMTQMAKDVKAGMSQDAALLEYRHNIWTEMSQKGYLKYERIPISQITANFNPNHDAHSGEFTSGAGGSAADEAARATAKGRGYTVPPAWKNVWVNPDPHADLQVTGFDSKGRKQYIYSATAANRNSAAKFARIKNFTNDYDGIMNRIKGDMVHGAHSEEARVLYLISQTGFRVGGASDTGADKQAFGATTLLKSHVTVEGNKTTFNFVGKKGVVQNHTIEDPVIAGMFKGKRDGRLFNTTDAKVRDYLHSITPHYKVKDFRTYVATGTALQVMATMSKPSSKSAYDKAVKQVSTVVSQKLGNTPAMAKGSYIDPAVWGSWSKVINR
jgi:DNA topoisomerase-1